MYGITFNNKHSFKDFNLRVIDRDVQTPAKKKILMSVPYSNVEYDFSSLYGKQVYEPRVIEYIFQIDEMIKNKLELLRISVENWLNRPNEKIKLIDDLTPGYYFLAECISTNFKNLKVTGEITVTFNAYPFRIRDEYEGELLWDNFCFETDVLQDTSFDISGSKNINLYNNSAINVSPTVVCTSNMEIIKDHITYNFNSGITTSPLFEINIGENSMVIKGSGNIKFKFKSEVL